MTIIFGDKNKTQRKKTEFSKLILIVELLVLIALIVCAVKVPEVSFEGIVCAWIGVIGASTAAYYWKAKTENRVKVPMKVVEGLPEDIRDSLDLTQIITAIIQSE